MPERSTSYIEKKVAIKMTNGTDETTSQWMYGGQADAAGDTTVQHPVWGQDETTVVTERVYASAASVAAQQAEQATQVEQVAQVEQVEQVRDSPDAGAKRGQTTIADEVVERVIEKIIELAVAEIPAMHGLRPGVDRFFGGTDDGETDRAVSVRLDGERSEINIAVEVEFGHPVHEAVEKLRASVIGSTERLLGLTIAEVNVAVADVTFPASGPDGRTS